MNSIFLTRLFRLFILLLFQVLVFNNIHLLGYITPLVIGYMVVCMHRNASRIAVLVWGFVIGLLFDTFSNTAGMGAFFLVRPQKSLLIWPNPHQLPVRIMKRRLLICIRKRKTVCKHFFSCRHFFTPYVNRDGSL